MRRNWRALALLTLGVVFSQRPLGAQSGAARPDSVTGPDSLAERRKQAQVRAAHDAKFGPSLNRTAPDPAFNAPPKLEPPLLAPEKTASK